MSILINGDLKRLLTKEPPLFKSSENKYPVDFETQIQPASFDLRLSRTFWRLKLNEQYQDGLFSGLENWEKFVIEETCPIILNPGDFLLGQALEEIHLPANMLARIESRQSIARLGLLVCNANLMNPGYSGIVPLQLKNISDNPVVLRPFFRICTVVIFKLEKDSEVPYNKRKDAKYAGQKEITPSFLPRDIDLIDKIVTKEYLDEILKENALIVPKEDLDFFNQFFEDTTRKILSEAYYICRFYGRDKITQEDIKKGANNIKTILKAIQR
nr:dCTP deaminase [Candidatus Sigynarchaeota archaeon]